MPANKRNLILAASAVLVRRGPDAHRPRAGCIVTDDGGRPHLRDLGQVYVTLAAARAYGQALGLRDEEARRSLTAALVAHGRVVEGAVTSGATAGVRARSRALGQDIHARVSREDDGLLVVVAVQVRRA